VTESTIEAYMARFLEKKGYTVQIQPDYPSTIDIMAVKDDSLVLIEVKSKDRIDASDVASLKSYEELMRQRVNAKKSRTVSFIYSKGVVSGSAQELSKEYDVEILKPGQIGRFYSHDIFKKKQ
jgi:Holliday junction resolvase-like predicted endonuclease